MGYFVLIEGMSVEKRQALDVELGDPDALRDQERESFSAVADRLRAQRERQRQGMVK